MRGDLLPARVADDAEAGPAFRSFRAWLAALVVSLAVPLGLAVLLAGHDDLPDDIADLVLTQALRLDRDGQDLAVPQPVSLPYRCVASDVGLDKPATCRAKLQVSFRHDFADLRPWSVYLPSYQGTLTVSVNGAVLASSQWEQSPAAFATLTPMLLPVPMALLREGENQIELEVVQSGAFRSFLGWVAVGPDIRLRPHHDQRLFSLSTLPQIMHGWQIAMGLGLLLVWLARRHERMFLLFGTMALFHALASLPAIMGGALDPWLVRLAFHGRLVAVCLLLPAAFLFVGRRCPIPFPVFLLPPVIGVVSYVLLPLENHAQVIRLFALPVALLIIAATLAVFIHAGLRDRNGAALLLASALLSTMVLAVFDGLALMQVLNTNPFMLVRFGPPVFLTLIGGVLVWRFAHAMNQLDRFNARLESAVAQAEDVLRQSFARERAQSRAMVLEAERIRLMSDLHDGIAGQLVSILALCELPDRDWGQIEAAVRTALADLRLVIASLDDSGDDLGMMLALFRERIEPQLASFGIALEWRMADLPDLPGLHPGASLNIFRILQEAAINAARHSGSATLRIEASVAPNGCVRLMVRDCGRGGAARRAGSYGLDNMRRRATALGAGLEIQSGAQGTTIVLGLPARLPDVGSV